VIPAAGLGTRFLPASKAVPKEMLPIVDKPVIQYIIEGAVASGIEEVVHITATAKRAIEDHFDRFFELEYRLEASGKLDLLEEMRHLAEMAKFVMVRQGAPLGNGHAVLLATHDVELAAEVATRVVIVADGEIVADGVAAGVLSGSPAFAPQVAKILHPLPYLTVDQVVAALGEAS